MVRLFETQSNNFRLVLFEGDSISEQIRAGQAWEPHLGELIPRLISEGDNVCDGGANFGYHALAFARAVGGKGSVYAFEPQPVIFQQLCFHLFLNQIANVRAFPQALGAAYGRTKIPSFDKLFAQNLGVTPVGEGEVIVDLIPLDHYAHLKFSFLKIDVQGCELMMLKGAKKIIDDSRPVLFLEIEEMWLRRLNTSSKELIDYLFSLNYTLYRIDTEYPCDHLCVPREKIPEIEEKLKGVSFQMTKLEGAEIELEFAGKPYYSGFKIVR